MIGLFCRKHKKSPEICAPLHRNYTRSANRHLLPYRGRCATRSGIVRPRELLHKHEIGVVIVDPFPPAIAPRRTATPPSTASSAHGARIAEAAAIGSAMADLPAAGGPNNDNSRRTIGRERLRPLDQAGDRILHPLHALAVEVIDPRRASSGVLEVLGCGEIQARPNGGSSSRRSRRRSACPSSVADAAARPPRPPPGVSAGAIDGAAMVGLAGLPTPHSDIDQLTSERSAGDATAWRRPPASARSQPAVQSALDHAA